MMVQASRLIGFIDARLFVSLKLIYFHPHDLCADVHGS
jgi:hypothetical protein